MTYVDTMKVPILPMPQFPILGLGLTVLYQCHDLCSPIRINLTFMCQMLLYLLEKNYGFIQKIYCVFNKRQTCLTKLMKIE